MVLAVVIVVMAAKAEDVAFLCFLITIPLTSFTLLKCSLFTTKKASERASSVDFLMRWLNLSNNVYNVTVFMHAIN